MSSGPPKSGLAGARARSPRWAAACPQKPSYCLTDSSVSCPAVALPESPVTQPLWNWAPKTIPYATVLEPQFHDVSKSLTGTSVSLIDPQLQLQSLEEGRFGLQPLPDGLTHAVFAAPPQSEAPAEPAAL